PSLATVSYRVTLRVAGASARSLGGQRVRARGIGQHGGRLAGAGQHEVATQQPAAIDQRLGMLAIHALASLEQRGRALGPRVLDPLRRFGGEFGVRDARLTRTEADDLAARDDGG